MIPPEILKEISLSRAAISRDVKALRTSVDFPERAKQAVRRRPAIWLGGAALTGFLAAWLPPRTTTKIPSQTRKSSAPTGSTEVAEAAQSATWVATVFAIGKFLLPLLRPAITAFAAKHLSHIASKLQ